MQGISERSKGVNSECFPSYHSCSTWHFIPCPRTTLIKSHLTSFALHHQRLPTACNNSFFLHQLICPLTALTPAHHMRWGGEEQNDCAQKEQINHWKLNHGIYFPILSSVFHCSGTDPQWWMIIIYSTKPDIYLMWLRLMCSLPLFTRCTFIYIVTVWIECVIVMVYMQDCAHMWMWVWGSVAPIRQSQGAVIKNGTSGFLDVRRQQPHKICIQTAYYISRGMHFIKYMARKCLNILFSTVLRLHLE